MNNRERGDRSEAASILMLLQAGYKVLVPWGQNQRYDAVLDTPEGFKKVQCKTGRLERNNEVLVFNSCSNRANYFIKKRTHYRGQVDYFAVYCHELSKAYLVPVELAGVSAGTLRLQPTRPGQRKSVPLASKFEITSQINVSE